jgi:uncharacterized membrane protein YphA (DoxX/SURF4 family)
MFIAALVVSILLAALMAYSAVGKLTGNKSQLATMEVVGFPADRLWMLATVELVGAAGLIAGLFWWPLGIAAAIGSALYFVSAIVAHLRVKDSHFIGALLPLALAIAALVLRLLAL